MTDIARRLDLYADLSPGDRAEVDAYVADHPEWAARLAEAQAFAALLDAAAAPDDVARRVVDERMGGAPADGPEADRVRDRLDALASEAEDPVAKFERLTGRPLADAPARPLGLVAVAPDRPAARPAAPAPRRLPRWVALAAAVVVVAYGGLYAASAASVSDRDRLADLGALAAYEPPVTRGAGGDALAGRLDAALDAVDAARRSRFGLFPSYDTGALDVAAADLEGIVREAAPLSAVSQEARFALGRVRFAQGRDAEAARVLGTLVREGSYRGAEARRLLDAIRAQG